MRYHHLHLRVMPPVERLPPLSALKRAREWSNSSELMQLKLQRKIDKLKKKLKYSKSHQLTSSSSSNEETDDSSEEQVKGKRGRNGDKRSRKLLPLTMIICLSLTPSPR
jgi:hypothetical protein